MPTRSLAPARRHRRRPVVLVRGAAAAHLPSLQGFTPYILPPGPVSQMCMGAGVRVDTPLSRRPPRTKARCMRRGPVSCGLPLGPRLATALQGTCRPLRCRSRRSGSHCGGAQAPRPPDPRPPCRLCFRQQPRLGNAQARCTLMGHTMSPDAEGTPPDKRAACRQAKARARCWAARDAATAPTRRLQNHAHGLWECSPSAWQWRNGRPAGSD